MALKIPKNQVNYMVHKMPNTAFHSQDTVPVLYTNDVPSERLFKYVFLIQVKQLFIRFLRIHNLNLVFVRPNPKSLWFWTFIRL